MAERCIITYHLQSPRIITSPISIITLPSQRKITKLNLIKVGMRRGSLKGYREVARVREL